MACDGADRELDRAIDFCLTFLKIANIIAFERVANQRKSSFVTRFLFYTCLKKCVAYQRKSSLWDKCMLFLCRKTRRIRKWQKVTE